MKLVARNAGASLALVLFVAVLWFALRCFGAGDAERKDAPIAITSLGRETALPDVIAADHANSERVEVFLEAVAMAPIPEGRPESSPTQESKPPVLEARDWIEIQVVDDQQVPLPDAVVTIRGLRSHSSSGSWFPFRGEKPVEHTDFEGRVSLSYWAWVNIDGQTRAIDLNITHPDFVSFRDSSYAIGPGAHIVELQRGSIVVVSGWIGSPENIVADLTIRVDRETRLGSDAWQRGSDGRLTSNRLAPGQHLIWAEHESEAHGHRFSEIGSFELLENDFKVLRLELHGAERIEGEVDQLVPRPIVEGHVMLSVQRGGLGAGAPAIYRKHETPIRADGTFSFDGLPRGRGQIFALCQGWVSQRTLADSALDAGIHFGGPVSEEREREAIKGMGDRAFQLQRITLPLTTRPFTVLMEPTATVDIVVKLQDGTPVAGAFAGASPNLSFIGVGSSIAPWRKWRVETDSEGRARIEDLPRNDRLWAYAQHPDYQMLEANRQRPVEVEVRSGETSSAEVILEPKDR